jgi:hypothetical protein
MLVRYEVVVKLLVTGSLLGVHKLLAQFVEEELPSLLGSRYIE